MARTTPHTATKRALRAAARSLDLDLDVDRMVYRGGCDPGGWTRASALVCVIHEATGLPNDYNHPDPLGWWDALGEEVSRLSGTPLYFEWINGCVAAAYPV